MRLVERKPVVVTPENKRKGEPEAAQHGRLTEPEPSCRGAFLCGVFHDAFVRGVDHIRPLTCVEHEAPVLQALLHRLHLIRCVDPSSVNKLMRTKS
jgi:hypothetical protein